MNLIPVNVKSIRIGQPLPVALRDNAGTLLVAKGYVIEHAMDLDFMCSQRDHLYVDIHEAEHHDRAYMEKLNRLIRNNVSLGRISAIKVDFTELEKARYSIIQPKQHIIVDQSPDLLDLPDQLHNLLHNSHIDSFKNKLHKLEIELNKHVDTNPDGTLLALMYLSHSELHRYSATHAVLVSVMCSLAAREVLKWPHDLENTMVKSALTMNIGMFDLQDKLAQQTVPLTPEQRKLIETHSERSAEILTNLGVNDHYWLDTVLGHHTQAPGPLQGRSDSQLMSRLIQRADTFAAKLAPRASRAASSPAKAMQTSYFDENSKIDEAGAALIKAVGVYAPGSLVKLMTNEIAIVVKRGMNTATPHVVSLLNREGMPIAETVLRDTSRKEFKIVTGVAYNDIKIKIPAARLRLLTNLSKM